MAELKAAMSWPELRAWREYYRDFPFDDRHRYHRPAALIASRVRGAPERALEQYLEWLEPDPATAGYSNADLNTLQAFGLRPPPKR